MVTLHSCVLYKSQKKMTFALCNINRLVLYNRGGEFTVRCAPGPYIKGLIIFGTPWFIWDTIYSQSL